MDFEFSVYRRVPNPGNKSGNTDALLNIPDEGSKLSFTMDERSGQNWIFKGAKFYHVYPNTIRQQKDQDIQTLRNGKTESYEEVFNGELPEGISFEIKSDKTLVVTDNAADGDGIEYLIWIQDGDDSNENDYVDPGIRNRW